jgi:diguanylate cyclase (GGDEF)-like protein
MGYENQTKIKAEKFSMKRELTINFLLIFVPASIIFSGIFFAFSNQSHKYELQTILIREESGLRSAAELTTLLFEQKISDLMVLAEGGTLRKYLHNENMLNWVRVNREFSLFARRKPKYSQIRYIDMDGKERVRINSKTDEPEIVPKTQLQDKSRRYYFSDAIVLNQGDIYLSPLDLNVEQGAIEKPIVPTIRFATPVFDGYGVKRGIIVINYNPTELLDRIEDVFRTLIGDIIMLNSEGYWLTGEEEEKLWGFMYDSDVAFSTESPEVWASIKHRLKGSVSTDNGLYIFQRAYPLNRSLIGSVENIEISPNAGQPKEQDRNWIYVSHISREFINELSSKRELISKITYALLFLVTGLISGVFARNRVQKKFAFIQLRQHATTDELTRLANRHTLNMTGESEFQRALRFGRDYSILMIDLDHFKKINDSYGHTIGDEVLKHVANICLGATRIEDLLARFGGEEFVMLLPETDIEGARQLAERICQDIRERPFDSGSGSITITVSIGVSGIRSDDQSYSNILERADRALYQAKREGRDRVALI